MTKADFFLMSLKKKILMNLYEFYFSFLSLLFGFTLSSSSLDFLMIQVGEWNYFFAALCTTSLIYFLWMCVYPITQLFFFFLFSLYILSNSFFFISFTSKPETS
jgi:hypothetical protein